MTSYANRGRYLEGVARRLVAALERNTLYRRADWAGWYAKLRRLPEGLQLWVWRQVRRVVSAETYSYLRRWEP